MKSTAAVKTFTRSQIVHNCVIKQKNSTKDTSRAKHLAEELAAGTLCFNQKSEPLASLFCEKWDGSDGPT